MAENYSEITKQAIKILKPYIDTENSVNYKKYRGYHSGVDLAAKEVYNLLQGQIIYVKHLDLKYTVVVKLSTSMCISYSNLKSCKFSRGDIISAGEHIGSCFTYVHVEYLSIIESMWPVRFGVDTFYKNNPTDIILTNGKTLEQSLRSTILPDPIVLENTCKPVYSKDPNIIIIDKSKPVELDASMRDELSNGK